MEPKDLLLQLRDISGKLESSFEDMCEFQFTVQDGKLYVLSAGVATRGPAAAVRIATDLFLEGKITARTLISRIKPGAVETILEPIVVIDSNIRELGRGVPASSGAATGAAAFSANSVLKLKKRGTPSVFLLCEFTPEDIHGLDASVGAVSFLGGMTSHAAVICRGMRKPCVSAVGWSFDRAGNITIRGGSKIREGDPLTIDGTSGIVYSGSAHVEIPNALQNDRLLLILRGIDALSSENELPHNGVGRAWLTRDIMLHGSAAHHRQDPEQQLKRWPVSAGSPATAYRELGAIQLQQLTEELLSFRLAHNQSDQVEIWRGLRTCLLRLLSKHVGAGRHPEFCRPLFDPCQAVVHKADSSAWGCRTGHRAQLVGEEFFSINCHVPELIEIATIRLYWTVECASPAELWRIDRTNPAGEKLREGSADLKALKVVVNDATVSSDLLPIVYNSLRRHEYFWNWYRANRVSRREIVDLMMRPKQFSRRQAREVAERAGLISETDVITFLGESLLHPSTASERARVPIRIGW